MLRIPRGLFGIVKEAARHLLRRPVVGIAAYACTADGRVVLIRRGDTGEWALPGGTLEWGERLRSSIERELLEEAGVELVSLDEHPSVYSDPARDLRFHAVTVVVRARVSEPRRPPMNPMEILEVGLFEPDALPSPLAHGMSDMVEHARRGGGFWE
jgi:8-oxo-dGTP diphosphatase